jgi:tetratricopeptide (TPR) repeat protein
MIASIIIATLLSIGILSWVIAAFKTAISHQELGFKEIFSYTKQYSIPLILHTIMKGAILFFSYLAFIIPGIIFHVWFYFSSNVLIEEDIAGLNALYRSKEYVRGRWFKLYGRIVLVGVIASIIGIIPILGQLVMLPIIVIFNYVLYNDFKNVSTVPESDNKKLLFAIIGVPLLSITIFIFIGISSFKYLRNMFTGEINKQFNKIESQTQKPVQKDIVKPITDLPNQTDSITPEIAKSSDTPIALPALNVPAENKDASVNSQQAAKDDKINTSIDQKSPINLEKPNAEQKQSVPEKTEPITTPLTETNNPPKQTISARTHIDQGLSYVISGNYKQALEEFNDAIEINPKSPTAYYNRGIVYSRLGNNAESMKDLNMAASLGNISAKEYLKTHSDALPGQTSASQQQTIAPPAPTAEDLYKQGTDSFKKGKYQEAIKSYNAAIKVKPKYVEAYIGRGAVYSRLIDDNQAIKDYTMAIGLDPKNPNAYVKRGDSYRNIYKYQEAMHDYQIVESMGYKDVQDRLQNLKDYLKKNGIGWVESPKK